VEMGVSLFNYHLPMKQAKEICIVGGGLAGLSLAILAAKDGWNVHLFEKNTYPRQKVCGEYISMESYAFLASLGLQLAEINPPQINQFVLTTTHGLKAKTYLQTGGFGLSRWFLDEALYKIAVQQGVHISCNTKVNSVNQTPSGFEVVLQNGETMHYPLVVGAFGRISGLQSYAKKNAFIGVKYHVSNGPNENQIEIHQFKGGYCGISKVENNAFNLCYLTEASSFKKYKGNIDLFEKEVLYANPFLKERLQSKRLSEPVITSQIQFGTSNSKNQNYPLLGDAAGFIPPLTGNGMSLAFRSAFETFKALQTSESQGLTKGIVQKNNHYIQSYLRYRINKGIFLQRLLFVKNPIFNKLLCYGLVYIPGLLKILSKQAVGKKIV